MAKLKYLKSALKDNDNHELELKFEADRVSPQEFVAWAASTGKMTGYRQTSSPDVYYRQGKNVLRFRSRGSDETGATITVKLRTKKENTTNRVEIDVPVSKKVSDDNLHAFLEATGWEPELRIWKDSHIIDLVDFWFDPETQSPPVCLAMYEVWEDDDDGEIEPDSKWYIEVEVEKEFINKNTENVLRFWEDYLRERFPAIGKLLNRSLYEIYSGKKYRVVKL
jgi:hypothetical protein